MRTMEFMTQKQERLSLVREALSRHGTAALVCANGMDVLLLSGYWPVTGMSVAIVTAEPQLVLVVPQDEHELARVSWADQVLTYEPGSLTSLQPGTERLSHRLEQLLPTLALERAHVLCGNQSGHKVSTYVAQASLEPALQAMLAGALPEASLSGADTVLAQLRMRPTSWERERIRLSCRVAASAYELAAPALLPGVPERLAAQAFLQELAAGAADLPGTTRADGFFYCMSGPNAARAWAAFQQSSNARLESGQPVLVHCNSYVDGYWTDLTRTYVLGPPDPKLADMFDAIVAAREAALSVIKPGIQAAEVDRAARAVLNHCGFGPAFKHATGHGVGFSPIDHEEAPRLHPQSLDMLDEGMVFNVEPGIYIDGWGGLRDCNMVAVTGSGYEILSGFHLRCEEMVIGI